MKKRNVLITGSSSGLGLSLVDVFLTNNYRVFGISRSPTPRQIPNISVDFCKIIEIELLLEKFLEEDDRVFDYVFLNAGTIKPIKKAADISVEEFIDVLKINVVFQSQILNFLLNKGKIKNVIAVSSGASKKAYDGWLVYCVAKSALNQMISCYALENKKTHFLSLAPGIIKTKMQDYIKSKDVSEFSSLKKFHELYEILPSADEVANKIYDNLDLLRNQNSGDYFDLREI
jgi:benzil reductase ((S)-benzoin forming)